MQKNTKSVTMKTQYDEKNNNKK